jgi:hypothetical protein
MNFPETIRRVAFVGMKHEADDIIDYIVIRASLLISVVTGAVLAIWIGRAVGPWAGMVMGVGAYAVSMRICALMFFRSRHPR